MAPKRSSLRTSSFNSKALLNSSSNASSSADHNATATTTNSSTADHHNNNDGTTPPPRPTEMVLKVTSISSRHQRDIAEKEARLLAKLSHPSIVKMFDTGYRTVPISSSHHHPHHQSGGGVMSNAFRSNKSNNNSNNNNSSSDGNANGDSTGTKQKERTQHMILMEYCEGGHALHVCTQLKQKNERFDLSTLIIAFGQICNAVSYLHAQRPPIVHRDLKPENFLIKSGAYKLCDFGSAIFGPVELKTSKDRHDEEEVIEKTTTQMFRAPEMVDLFMSKKLTQATDVWALGCCLYALAYLKNCFEEGSNLAIISRNYKIPDDNPYGDGLVELIDRMLTQDAKCRADMTEVILCLSAVYSGKPLPPRKERKTKEKKEKESSTSTTTATTTKLTLNDTDDLTKRKVKEAKKLDPNSAAARRRQAAAAVAGVDPNFTTFTTKFENSSDATGFNQDLAFSTTQNPFADFDGSQAHNNNNNNNRKDSDGTNIFGSFTDMEDGKAAPNDELLQAFSASSADWDSGAAAPERGRSTVKNRQQPPKVRSRSQDHRRKSHKKDETPEEAIERLSALHLEDDDNEDDDDDDRSMAESVMTKGGTVSKKLVARRGVRRMVSNQQPRPSRSVSRGAGLRRTKSNTHDGLLAATSGAVAAASLYRNSHDQDDDDDDDED